MARRDKFGLLRGSAGELTFRVIDGKQVVQQRINSMKQTKLTKKAGKLFGYCSTQGALFRKQLKPWINKWYDKQMPNRFLAHSYKVAHAQGTPDSEPIDFRLANMQNLKGFEFQINSPIATHFTAPIQLLGTPETGLSVHIPSFSARTEMLFPHFCYHADLRIIFLTDDNNSTNFWSDDYFTTEISLSKDIQDEITYQLPSHFKPGLTIVILQLVYFQVKKGLSKIYLNDENLNPMQIIYAY